MSDELKVQVALAEFAAMRSEIDRRSETQDRLIQINTVGLGVLGALYLEGVASPGPRTAPTELLFVIPPLAASLGLLWVSHARSIRKKGRFIDENPRKIVTEILGDDRLLSNEDSSLNPRRSVTSTLITTAIPVFTLFLIAPSVALLIIRGTWDSLDDLARVVWIVEAGLVVVAGAFIFDLLRKWR